MKLYGSLSRLVSILFRKNSQDLTFRPNQATTYTAARDVQFPPGDTDHTLVSATSTQTLTNKTLTAPTVNNGSLNSIDTFSLDDSDSAFDLTIQSTSTLTAGRTLTIDVDDGARTVQLGGNLTLAANLSTSGANSLTLTTTGSTNVTLPTTGTLATLAGAEALTNKTLIAVDNLQLDGNTISSTDSNGNIVLDPNGTGVISAAAQVNVTGALRSDTSLILEETGAGTDTITIQAPASIAASYTLTLPVDDGTPNQVLQTDGSGVLSWATTSSFSSFAADWDNADGATKVITHNLGTKDVQVEIYDTDDDSTLLIDSIVRTDTNTVTLTSSEAPAVTWRVTIHAV